MSGLDTGLPADGCRRKSLHKLPLHCLAAVVFAFGARHPVLVWATVHAVLAIYSMLLST